LTPEESAGIRRAVQGCWNKSTASSEAQRSRIVIKVSLTADASVSAIELLESNAPNDAAERNAVEIARRSLRCLPQAGLPAEKYETWKEIEFEFDYSADRVR
ncbi:MAG: energy transducer TonB, partial [Gemmobacter sp.]